MADMVAIEVRLPMTPELLPKDGTTLRAVAVCRSGADRQVSKCNVDELQQVLSSAYAGPIEWIVINSIHTGMRLEDEQLEHLVELIESGRIDVLICSSLDRIGRARFALAVLGLCEEHGVRLIAAHEPFDSVRCEKLYDFIDAMDASLQHARRLLRKVGRTA